MDVRTTRRDDCSAGNITQIDVKHVDIDWSVNFDKQQLIGSATFTLEAIANDVDHVCFDGRDLQVSSAVDCTSTYTLNYTVADNKYDKFGQVITINFIKPMAAGEQRKICVSYATSATGASALQWMSAQQTADKKHAFMYSQCQAIHARSVLPCIDSPSVKFTYSARVTAPRGVLVLMSAVADETHTAGGNKAASDDSAVYYFQQTVPIPSYLLAIVAGVLEKRDLSHRCAVYAEPSIVDAAQSEFVDTELMLSTAESMLGPYQWGRYDLLVLPSTFPYGGMENPCLTFVTPSLLVGDRSLVNVVAHEISHSWTGNLVTNGSWSHFWLNEGNTVFVERKILAKMYGEPMRHFKAYDGYHISLKDTVDRLMTNTPAYTQLVHGEMFTTDPDDVFSSIPYEKGSALLMCIEQCIGRARGDDGVTAMNGFLKHYVNEFARKTVTTDQWKTCLMQYFAKEATSGAFNDIDWEKWFYGVGMPPMIPNFNLSSDLRRACVDWVAAWLPSKETKKSVGFNDDHSFTALTIDQKVHVMGELAQETLPTESLERMEKLYKFNEEKNPEIVAPWFRLCIKSHWAPAVAPAVRFAVDNGRMKYCSPVFRVLYEWPESRATAVNAFTNNRPYMHGITAASIEAMFRDIDKKS